MQRRLAFQAPLKVALFSTSSDRALNVAKDDSADLVFGVDLGPAGHEAPSHFDHLAAGATVDNHVDLVRRRHVVAGSQIARTPNVQGLVNFRPCVGLGKSSAHVPTLATVWSKVDALSHVKQNANIGRRGTRGAP